PLAHVVAAIRHAGEIAARSYSEVDLWDSTAFGAVLWRLTWNHSADALHELGITTWFDENSLRFTLAEFECAVYAGGHDPLWDIHRYDFTRTAKRQQAANPAQGRLFDLRRVDPARIADPKNLKSLTFVYCGSPQQGVVAIYLGAPVRDGSAFRWGWVECLYRSDGEPLTKASAAPDFPPFTDQPEGDFDVPPITEAPAQEGLSGEGA
ncbi:MAG: hypothetical protein ACXVFI_19265, partial [Solirubrobacteraceae bacterium]